ncbi:MAG: hypothetical protein QOJ97_1463 [Solirubrobacteraceae bacterium]|jgi:PAS domain S-box-containing protein|nr:hypothetical protein [Solirubrobacteraceae bacterium]
MSSVLVVDHRASDRALLATVLGDAGYAVREAATGQEALDLVRAQPPDLIIADILTPTMDGYELVRELRSEPAGAQIPVVFCAAIYAVDEVRQLADACGVTYVIVKSGEPGEVVSIVAAALRVGRVIPRPLPPADFHREHLRVLNAKLVQKIEEIEEAKALAAESLTLMETLAASAPVGFGFVDRDLRLARMNDTLAAVAGLPVEEQLGRTVAEVVPGLWPQLEPIYRHVLDVGEAVVSREVSGSPPDSPEEIRHWLASHYPVRLDGEVIGIGLVVVDITERRRAEDFRSVVMDNMAEGLYVVDGDGCITFMNHAASMLLGWTEDELRGKPAHATIHFQRLDGTAVSEEECEILAARTAGKPIAISSDAFTRKDGTIMPVDFSAAPLAGAPGLHGAVVVFRDITDEQAERVRVKRELDSLSWVGRTRDALDEGRLVLYSQPIISLSDGKPNEELLLRMVGREDEVIAPGRFLPAAEQFGLIVEIDEWVVTQAIRLAATGRGVAANLSAESVGNGELLSLIEEQLRETGADPSDLVFEITETALMGDIDAGQAFAEGLVELGCGVALDDFGTGFGSFTYLKRLPVTYLKIDIEFVRHLASNRSNQHIVKAIVSLAQGFGHQTIAEGVEDEATLELLRDYGVDFAQGFHIGRPAPLKLTATP